MDKHQNEAEDVLTRLGGHIAIVSTVEIKDGQMVITTGSASYREAGSGVAHAIKIVVTDAIESAMREALEAMPKESAVPTPTPEP